MTSTADATRVIELPDGFIVCGDVADRSVLELVLEACGMVRLIVADPPYGEIVKAHWDRVNDVLRFVEWMFGWTNLWTETLVDGGAFYVWGGVGKYKVRPFLRYMADVEDRTPLSLEPITWRKKRGYGTQTNYLFCREEVAELTNASPEREELAYLLNSAPRRPSTFHVPYLDQKRGYAGYNKDYPAKSEHLRRTTVWDETEILRDKLHECQKADRVCEIPIEVHTNPDDTVVELFGGSGSTAAAAQRLGRRYVVVENDPYWISVIEWRLTGRNGPKPEPPAEALAASQQEGA